MKFCPKCGNEVVQNAKFCTECGCEILRTEYEKEHNDPEDGNKRLKISSEQYIVDFLNASHLNTISVIPNIPEKKLVTASVSIADNVDPNIIIGLIDLSVLANGKSGVVFTGKDLYIKTRFSKTTKVSLENIDRVYYSHDMVVNDKGKEVEVYTIEIIYTNNESIEINSKVLDNTVPYQLLQELLEGFNENVDEISARSQVIQLSKMNSETIVLYFRIIIAYLKDGDGIIDSSEYKELLSLMTKVKMNKDIASELREYRFENKETLSIKELIEEIKVLLNDDNISEISVLQSLGFDIIGMYYDKLEEIHDNQVLMNMLNRLSITDQQIKFITRKLKAERKIITEKLDNKQINEITSELAAVASAAGVSLGALAITGAVTGWGAGISGGILAVGFGSGGALIGLAAIASAGYGAYKGVKYFSGTGQLEKYGIRINTLNNRISQLRIANAYIIEDINALSQQLVTFSEKLKESHELSGDLFQELEHIITQNQSLSNASDLIKEEEVYTEYELTLMSIPEELNLGKYNELLANSVNKVHYDELIKQAYQLTGEVEDEDITNSATLKDNVEIDKLHQIKNILEEIGYFDTRTSSIAQGKSLMKKGFSGLKKSFNEGKSDG